jgi:hypothetical protein
VTTRVWPAGAGGGWEVGQFVPRATAEPVGPSDGWTMESDPLILLDGAAEPPPPIVPLASRTPMTNTTTAPIASQTPGIPPPAGVAEPARTRPADEDRPAPACTARRFFDERCVRARRFGGVLKRRPPGRR